jgi:metal-responsive CopG/Arc/MetJ family transcriptional regulator
MTKINISIPEDFLKEMDTLKDEENISRSELLRKSVRMYKEMLKRKKEEEERRERVMEAVHTQDYLRGKSGKWDGVKEIRKWREGRK